MTQHISRIDAKAKGLRMFFTGVACKHGHVAERYTSTGQCHSCLSASNRRRYDLDPQAVVKRSAAWRKKHPEKHAESMRRTRYKKLFGLSLEQIEEMKAKQNNLCLCCTRTLGSVPHVDHCHTTGKVRGILCGPCNQAIGLVKEDVATLARMIAYLDR